MSLPLVSIHRHGRINSVNVEIHFISSASSILRQMHLVNVSESIEAISIEFLGLVLMF